MSSANRRRTTSSAHPAATLVYRDISPQLDKRTTRPPNYEHEARALSLLAREMAENPRNILQCFVEIAVYLCDAGAAGIHLLDGDLFRWVAVAGTFAAARSGTMPGDQGPSRACIDRNATQLMQLADGSACGSPAEPRFAEALLIPFGARKQPVGTIWVVGDTRGRTFDREDERVVRVLAQIASAGWQLWKASEAGAASSRHKDDFIAMVSHELRNPFAAITTAAGNLHRFVDGDAAAHRSIDVIVRQSHHVSRLLDDLLDIARTNSGKLHLERGLIDVRSVVAETIDTRRAQIARRRQRLAEDLGEESILVEADPVRLAQIVSNLVENAIKYTPEGGHISVTLLSRGNDVELAVEDDGVGIPPERWESIFEPFTRLSSKETTEGLGLGLALVRNLTALHGGHVSVTSAGPGQGSRFVVRLPVRVQPEAAARSPRPESREPPGDPRATTTTM